MKKSPCIAGASLDGPIFEKLEDARNWCNLYHDRPLRSTARDVGCSHRAVQGNGWLGPLADPALVRDIERICEQVAQECRSF
jgi:hypothetical protein